MVYKQIGQRIRQERNKLRLTQEQLAELAGVNESYIGQIERAAKNPSLESLIKIAKALGVTIDYFLMDVIDVKANKLIDELTTLTKGRKSDEVRLLLSINRLVIEYLDNQK